MTVDILYMAITKLNYVGFTVVSYVSDMGPKNQGLHAQLQITPEKPYFEHPSNSEAKVYCFEDVPHLLKLIRNHLLDSNLTLADGRIVNRLQLDALVTIQTSQLKPGWKLSQNLLNVKGCERQNVKAAAILLSWNTARALQFVGDSNIFQGTIAQFI